MTKKEFSDILNRTHRVAIKELSESLSDLLKSGKDDLATVVGVLAVASVEAAENSILHALEESGFLSFDK